MTPAPIPVVKPGQKPPPFAELKAMYAYDTSEPLDFKELPNLDDTVDGVKFRGIGFEQNGETVAGYLALPDGAGPFPVVVYAPGWMTPVMDVDDGWATEAAAMVKRGYAGLLLDEPSTRLFTFDAPTDIAACVLYATQERRALDLLATMPEIDGGRIGFVGFSNGAIFGSLLAGLEDRIKAYVFLGACGMTTWTPGEKKRLNVPTGATWARYAAQMSVSDNIAYVGHNKGAKLLFINGKVDVSAMHDARAFLAAAPKGSTWHVYAGGHFPSDAANNYWQAWMRKNL